MKTKECSKLRKENVCSIERNSEKEKSFISTLSSFQTSAPRLPEPVVADSKISNYINNNNNSQQVAILSVCFSLKLSHPRLSQWWTTSPLRGKLCQIRTWGAPQWGRTWSQVQRRRWSRRRPASSSNALATSSTNAATGADTFALESFFITQMTLQAARLPAWRLHHVASHCR